MLLGKEIEHKRIIYENEEEKMILIEPKYYQGYLCQENIPIMKNVPRGEHVEVQIYYKKMPEIIIESNLEDDEIVLKSGYGFSMNLEVEVTVPEDKESVKVNSTGKVTFLGKQYEMEVTDIKVIGDEVIFTVQLLENEASNFRYRKIYTDVALPDGEYFADVEVMINTGIEDVIIGKSKKIVIEGHMYENYYTH